MMYGKLNNGELEIAPVKLIINDTQVWNAPAEEYFLQGWLPIIFVETPEPPDGYHYEESWTQDNNVITEIWTLVENEIDDTELLNILLGEFK